jgi:hypothetical protein
VSVAVFRPVRADVVHGVDAIFDTEPALESPIWGGI